MPEWPTLQEKLLECIDIMEKWIVAFKVFRGYYLRLPQGKKHHITAIQP